MSETKSKIVHIYRKYGKGFAAVNRAVLIEGLKHLGSSIRGKQSMMLNEEEMRSYMGLLIGVDPNSVDFIQKVNTYWDEFMFLIPEQGFAFEIGFNYSVTDNKRKDAIHSIFETNKVSKADRTDAKLAELVEENVDQTEKWKYAKPIDVLHYSTWKYCLNYSEVANNVTLANKSGRIQFYLHDDSQQRDFERVQYNLRKKATKAFISIADKEEEVANMLFAARRSEGVSIDKAEDRAMALESFKNEQPDAFLKLHASNDLKDIAYIERLIAYGLLERSIDPENPFIRTPDEGKVLGSSPREVIKSLEKEENIKLKNELAGKLKNIKLGI